MLSIGRRTARGCGAFIIADAAGRMAFRLAVATGGERPWLVAQCAVLDDRNRHLAVGHSDQRYPLRLVFVVPALSPAGGAFCC